MSLLNVLIPDNNCGEDIGGQKCAGDDSKLLHGTTNVYYAAISTTLMNTKSDLFACVREDEETIYSGYSDQRFESYCTHVLGSRVQSCPHT